FRGRWLIAAACLLLVACAPAPRTPYTELVYATPYAPGHPFSRADIEWMQFVEKASGGRLRIRPSWSGALLSSEHSMLELRHGVADVGLVTPIYVKAGVHLIRVQSGFYSGADTVEKQLALYRCLAAAHPEFDAEMQGLHVLAVQGGSLPGLLTRDHPVRRLEDLRGLRIRAPTELLSVLRHLGADPVNMPMGEVYSALAKGVIDGVIASGDTFKSLHFAEVGHYFSFLAVPRGAYPARAMSQHRWARLTDEERRVLEESTPVWENALARQTFAAQEGGFAAGRAAGVEFIDIDPAEQATFDRLYLKDAESNAAGLSRYGIDGTAVFHTARGSLRPDGSIACPGEG
ncbi:MAG TPA: TRAP transporter substrate-binding protein DctP, partial [Steroidobacteraceae bacterium]|nr:TRAP transporter substrate-binding protein DctP [Steroidobacteraceae bacterium]